MIEQATEQIEPLSQWVVDCTALAIKQGHRVTSCQNCGGPEIWSLANPESHCFRCNTHQQGSYAPIAKKKYTCEQCGDAFMAKGVLNTRFCKKCSGKWRVESGRATAPLSEGERLQKAAETDDV